MFKNLCRLAVVLVMVGLPVGVARAEVKLPRVIGSNMVLQRDLPARIWGWADVGEEVTVSVGEVPVPAVKAGADGKWEVKLPPQKAGGPITITVQGKNTIKLDNVLVGDVWVCSGQSNMVWQLTKSAGGKEEIAVAKHPSIRLFTVAHKVASQPQEDCEGKWVECSPETVRMFSGVAYYFGRDLNKALDVPIGLVQTAFGGTPVEAWTPMPVLESLPEAAMFLKRGQEYPARYAEEMKKYELIKAKWEAEVAQAKAQGEPEPRKPRAPVPPEKYPILPAVLYNGKIHPLTPLGIKGFIWYQGENNVTRAHDYRAALPAMIQSWRQAWGQGDVPFGIVQLANYLAREDQPKDAQWAELREAQALTAKNVPNCGLALAIDLGETKSIHPTNKEEVGRRLGLWALAKVYGKSEVVYSGPVYDKMKVEDGAIRITFKHVDGGLKVKDGQELKGFAIAGEDRKFIWAAATIEGDSVVVRSLGMAKPVAVRYAWANNPECNLYNGAGLPAGPFRTDDWPGMTTKREVRPIVGEDVP